MYSQQNISTLTKEFKTSNPASDRQQTYALDRANHHRIISNQSIYLADQSGDSPGGSAIYGVGRRRRLLLPSDWWDCGFEFRLDMNVYVSVLNCQVEVSATIRSLV